MTKNPLLNALAASLYIGLIASFMYYGLPRVEGEDTVLAPIAFLSLFTLSAAVMGYIFLYQPLQMFLDGEKKPAVNLFLHTVAYFAGVTFLFLLTLFFVGASFK